MSSNQPQVSADHPQLGEFTPLRPVDDPAVDVRGPETADISREFRYIRPGSIVHINSVYQGTITGRLDRDEREASPFDTDDLKYSVKVWAVDVNSPADCETLYIATCLDWDADAKYLIEDLDQPVPVKQFSVSNPSLPEGTATEMVDSLSRVVGQRVFYVDTTPDTETGFVYVVEVTDVRDGVVSVEGISDRRSTPTNIWVCEPVEYNSDIETKNSAARDWAYPSQWAIPPRMDVPTGKYRITDYGLVRANLQFPKAAVPKTDFVLEHFENTTATEVDTDWDVSRGVDTDGSPAPDDEIAEITGIGRKTALKMSGHNPNSWRTRRKSSCKRRLEEDDTVEIRELDADEVSQELLEAQANFEPHKEDKSLDPIAVEEALTGGVPLFELGQYYTRGVADVRNALLGEAPSAMDVMLLHTAATNATLYNGDAEKIVNYPELFFQDGFKDTPVFAPARVGTDMSPPVTTDENGIWLVATDGWHPTSTAPDSKHHWPLDLPGEGVNDLPHQLQPLEKLDEWIKPVTHADVNLATSKVGLFNAPDATPNTSTDTDQGLAAFTATTSGKSAHGNAENDLPADLEAAHLVSVHSDVLEYVSVLFGIDILEPLELYSNGEDGSLVIPHPKADCAVVVAPL
jgi:hypothetical protein